MTKQEQIVLLGLGAAAVTKFYYGKSWFVAGTIGLAAISAYAILSAVTSQPIVAATTST